MSEGATSQYSFIGRLGADWRPRRREHIDAISRLVVNRATAALGLPEGAIRVDIDTGVDGDHMAVVYCHPGLDIARSGVSIPSPLDPDLLACRVGEAIRCVLDATERKYVEDVAARTWLEKHRTAGGAGDAPGEEAR